MHQICAVYILANRNNTVLYTGVTSDLERRISEHKSKHFTKSFSARYNIDRLVYYETFESIIDAISREKQIKAGSRKKKIGLIVSQNPGWRDLTKDLAKQMMEEITAVALLLLEDMVKFLGKKDIHFPAPVFARSVTPKQSPDWWS